MIWFEFLPYNTFTDRLPLKPINRGIKLMKKMNKNFISTIYLFSINCLTLLKLLHSLGVAGTKSYKQIFFMKNHSFFFIYIGIKCIGTKSGFFLFSIKIKSNANVFNLRKFTMPFELTRSLQQKKKNERKVQQVQYKINTTFYFI